MDSSVEGRGGLGWLRRRGGYVLSVERETLALDAMALYIMIAVKLSQYAMYFFENWVMRIGKIII
jgi:hypothetical protein